VADSAQKGILSVFPDCEVVKVCVADGGEGTVDALLQTLGGRTVNIEVHDPLGRPVKVSYAILDDD
jgi:glycerate kinase